MAERVDKAEYWDWLRTRPLDEPLTERAYRGDRDPFVRDVMWEFVSAGIIRPDNSIQYAFTEAGQLVIAEDTSPYKKDVFLVEIDKTAPNLDPYNRSYLSLALMPFIPSPICGRIDPCGDGDRDEYVDRNSDQCMAFRERFT